MKRLLALAVAPLFLASVAVAAPESSPGDIDSSASNIAGFSHIRTDKLQFNINSGDFTIPGRFTASRAGSDISADSATGNSKMKQLHAVGNVIVHQVHAAASGAHAADIGQRPSTLTCDKLDVDGIKKVYYATGNMHFTQEGGREASSDRAVLDDISHILHMEGHVHVRNGGQTIEGDSLDYNTQTGDLNADGNVTITAPVETAAPGAAGPPGSPKKKHGLF
jgi:lipopolysaccharide assembly outer membrane protein LptD (OstA)